MDYLKVISPLLMIYLHLYYLYNSRLEGLLERIYKYLQLYDY